MNGKQRDTPCAAPSVFVLTISQISLALANEDCFGKCSLIFTLET